MLFRKLNLLPAIFFLCLFTFSNSVVGQNYYPILNQYSEWHVTNCFSGCITDKYYTIGDTVINNLNYTFLDKYHYNKNFVIREDTISRKVFMRLLAEPPTAKEYLLYDFSLSVNDTVSVQNPGSPLPKYAGDFIVDSIVIKPLLNSNRKFFYLHAIDSLVSLSPNTVWVEGIGSLSLINTPGAAPNINGVGQLSCNYHNGVNEYQNLDSITDCISVYPTIVTEVGHQLYVQVLQDFNTHSIVVLSEEQSSPLTIKLFNTNSSLEFEKVTIHNKTVINTENLSSGIFFLIIEDNKKRLKKIKFFNP